MFSSYGTARAWGYTCGDFRFADLTLPREGVNAEPRFFTDDEVRRIIINAPEPLSTIIAVTAVLGLRIGETLALRKSDVDFTKHIIRIRQSVDAVMRHGAASSLLADGATPAVVQRQLRHSDARITLGIYGHVIGNEQRNAVQNRSSRLVN